MAIVFDFCWKCHFSIGRSTEGPPNDHCLLCSKPTEINMSQAKLDAITVQKMYNDQIVTKAKG